MMPSFLQFQDEQDAFGPKALRPTVTKSILRSIFKGQLRIFEIECLVYFGSYSFIGHIIQPWVHLFYNNAITLFTSKTIRIRALDEICPIATYLCYYLINEASMHFLLPN